MASARITYNDKTNNVSDPDNVKKFQSADANQLKDAINQHADDLDLLLAALGINEGTSSIGEFVSLQVLQAAYPDGADGSYAIINDGIGTTPQVATYNDGSNEWETPAPDAPIVYVANLAALPGTGTASKLYLALDSGLFYYWNNAQYNVAGGQTSDSPIKYITNNSINWRTIKGEGNLGAGFQVGDQVYHRIASEKRLITGFILDTDITLPDDIGDTAKFERYPDQKALL